MTITGVGAKARPEPKKLRITLRTTLDRGELPRPAEWLRASEYELADRQGERFIVPTRTSETVVTTLPAEVLPRLAEVDLASAEEILAFVNAYGRLRTAAGNYAGLDVLGAQGLEDLRELEARWRRVARRGGGRDRLGEWLAEFQTGAGQLQSLIACRQELEVHDRRGRPSFSGRRLKARWPAFAPWESPGSRGEAWEHLLAGINAGLFSIRPELFGVVEDGRPFGPLVDSYAFPRELQRLGVRDLPVVRSSSGPDTLFGVCCAELANHLTADRRYRFCKFAGCGRLFGIQDGRSRYGGHRPDLAEYCRPQHARAQAMRAWRARKKDQETKRSRKGKR